MADTAQERAIKEVIGAIDALNAAVEKAAKDHRLETVLDIVPVAPSGDLIGYRRIRKISISAVPAKGGASRSNKSLNEGAEAVG